MSLRPETELMPMKKITAVLFVCFLALTLLSGCSDRKTTSINVYRATFNLKEPDQKRVKKVEKAINAYISDKIGVKINLHDIGSDEYPEAVSEAMDRHEANEVVNTILSDEFREYCTLIADWASKGYVSSDDMNMLTTDTIAG